MSLNLETYFGGSYLYLYGDVCFSMAQAIHNFGHRQMQLKPAKRAKSVNVIISTDGGSSTASRSIVSELRGLNRLLPVRLIASGGCMSAGVTILMSLPVEQRYSAPNTLFLIHQTQWSGSLSLNGALETRQLAVSEHQSILKLQQKHQEWLVRHLSGSNSKLTRTQVRAMMHESSSFSSKQALKYGVIGHIV